jgi:pyruvate kinase
MGFGPSERAAPNRWALIVGITDYIHLGDEEGGDLPGAERDARVMRDVLVQRWGFPTGNVRVLLNREATRAAIEEGLTGWLPSVVQPGDHVTVFFAGHGSQMWDESGDEDDGLDETIAPADVRRGSTDFDINDDEFGEWLAALPTDNVVVYLDNCNLGTATRDVTPFSRTRLLDRDLSQIERPESMSRRALPGQDDRTGFDAGTERVLELAAAQPHQAAVDAYFPGEDESEAFHGGAFTTFLVRELWRAPQTATYEEVFQGVREALKRNRFEQDPYLSEEVSMKSVRVFDVEGAGPETSDAALPITSADDDRAELDLAVEKGVDFVAASVVTSGEDVLAVNEAIEALDAQVPIVAKIERDAAVRNLDAIVEATYAVMVARGDLGVECPLEEVPLIQKRIVRRSQAAGVPVIIATEMLDSMIHGRRPSRAEASDVANAVLDGTDAVMLSGETAVGDHPVEVVETMDRIVRAVEASDEHAELGEQRVPPADDSGTDALARSARYLARDIEAQAIVVASESGYTALKVAKFRPGVPIVAATPSDRVRRQLALSWGVSPKSADLAAGGAASVIENAVGSAVEADFIDSGDTVVVLSGMMTQLERSTTNTLKVHVAAETLAVGRGVVSGRAVGPLARSGDGDLDAVPDGAVLYLPESFDEELDGDSGRLAGIVHGQPGMTGYPALVARELNIPMVSGVDLSPDVAEGTTVTLDGERGVLYAGDITGRAT